MTEEQIQEDRWWKQFSEVLTLLGGRERLTNALRAAKESSEPVVLETNALMMGGTLLIRLELPGKVSKGFPGHKGMRARKPE